MKKILITIATLFTLGSCADLELRPEFATTANIIFQDPAAFKNYLAKVYGAYILTGQEGPAGNADLSLVNDEGFTSYIRCYWKAQQLPTDEAVITWTDAGIQDLNTQTWSSDNQFIRVLYYRLMLIISLSNDFLQQSEESALIDYGYSQADIATVNEYRAEVRFLRAMAYWHALDLFRNVPLVTTVETTPPQQSNAEGIFSFIESELSDIENDIVEAQQNEYGRADKGALWMLQAKLYLNAEIYINQPKYTEAITALNKLFGAGYTIANDYRSNFNADNHNSPELIFTFPSDGVSSQGYGGTTFLVNAAILDSMTPADFGMSAGWNGIRTTPSFIAKWDDISGNTDSRAIIHSTGQTLEIDDLLISTFGYGIPKFTNMTASGEPGSNNTFADTDYPVFRLADAYLMYAEAVLRGGSGGSEATALDLVNQLRERAYGNTNGNISSAELTLDFILDERSRELYSEGTRRIDLIRYNRFTTQGVWAWKGGVAEGTTTSAHLNIYPIPATDLSTNPNLKQNDDY